MTRLANIVFGFLFSVVIVKAEDFSDPRYAGLEGLFAGHSLDNIFGIRSNRFGGRGYSGLNLGNLHGPKWHYANDYHGYAPETMVHHDPVHFSRGDRHGHHFSTPHLNFPRVHQPVSHNQHYAPLPVPHHEPVTVPHHEPVTVPHHEPVHVSSSHLNVHRPISHDQHFSRVYPGHHMSAPKVSLPDSIMPVYHPISSLGRASTYPSHHTFSRLQYPRAHHLGAHVPHHN